MLAGADMALGRRHMALGRRHMAVGRRHTVLDRRTIPVPLLRVTRRTAHTVHMVDGLEHTDKRRMEHQHPSAF